LHRTLNGFFSTCNSDHDETWGKWGFVLWLY
jgi:hypothetical protein